MSIIVKFHQRSLQDAVMKTCLLLKSQKVTIYEDLTKQNQELLTRVRHSPVVDVAWSWNGKILTKIQGQSNPKQFDLFDAITTVS